MRQDAYVRKFSHEQRAEIVRRINEGETQRALAREFDVTPAAINKIYKPHRPIPELEIQIVHSRDPDSECGITVYVGGRVYPHYVEIEDIDPGRGYDDEYIQERRDEALAAANAPGATAFTIAVAEAVTGARFERFAL